MTANLSPPAKLQFFDANGDPLVGAKLYTYAAGTTTPLATYTDYGAGTPNANPVITDSRGECSVWLGASLYKFALYTSANVLIWTVDNIGGALTQAAISGASGSSLVGFQQAGTSAGVRTVQAKDRERISVEDFYYNTSDDATAWQRAVDRLIVLGGGTLHATAPYYVLNAQVVVNFATITQPTHIYGWGSRVTTTGAIIPFKAMNGPQNIHKKISGLHVDHTGNSTALGAFEQVECPRLTWDCDVTADASVVATYRAWWLRQTSANGDNGSYWTVFEGGGVRSTGGVVIPIGVHLDGGNNFVVFDERFYLSGVVKGIKMTYPTGTTLPVATRGSSGDVKVLGAFEGVTDLVYFDGAAGGYGPNALIISPRIETVTNVLNIQGSTLNHVIPPRVNLERAATTAGGVVNPNSLWVNVNDPRDIGTVLESTERRIKALSLIGIDNTYDVLKLTSQNANSGISGILAGTGEYLRIQPVVDGGLVRADISAVVGSAIVGSLRSWFGISMTAVHARNLAGTKTLSGGSGVITFATAEADASYYVYLQGSAQETFVASSLATTGFTITSSNGSSTAVVRWLIIRV